MQLSCQINLQLLDPRLTFLSGYSLLITLAVSSTTVTVYIMDFVVSFCFIRRCACLQRNYYLFIYLLTEIYLSLVDLLPISFLRQSNCESIDTER